ncbi:hypothetical protein, partial [Limnohabitans sp.]|uniref:hypothetical protein n=1 Tax=Limnohabitans sp. TaxID=1907725 RepID=UPI0028A198DF
MQTLDEGVVALAVPAAPALGSAMVGAAAGGFSATSVGAAAAGLGLIAGGGGGSTPSTAVTVDVQTPATNPFDKIEAYNNGNGTTPAALTLLDYQAAGVTGVNSDNLAAVNAQVLKQINGGADTLSEVQALVAAANAAIQKIEDYNRGNGTTPPALTVDDYEAAGITGVTPENLDALNAQVLKQVDGGADSVPEVQALANGLNTAAAKLGEFAQANTQGIATPTGTVPVLANYTAAGVTGVTDGSPTISPVGFMAVSIMASPSATDTTEATYGNIKAINDSLASAAVTGAKADTPLELQAIVDAYKAILAEANDTANTAGDTVADATPAADPTAAQYATIGANVGAAATDADNLALLNDIVGSVQFADVDTIVEIENLARIANAIQTVAAGGTASPALTVEDLAK